MKTRLLIALILSAFCIVLTGEAYAKPVVGYVHVDSWDTSPAEAYELHRDGMIISSLYQDMPVYNNDLLIPKKHDCVIIEYISHECPRTRVNSSTRVYCRQQDDEPGFWQNVYDKLNIFSPRYDLDETQGTTLRSGDTQKGKGNEAEKEKNAKPRKPHNEKW
ncbi:hypothetical protein [Maridesulfovibrio sp.]|uniref:hypothetical protein n=1 Tax=Maridesulfovibrio sp. TaxID=2795000 RepID=UPI002A18DDE7|nr:hypothetical protein [Maridesulfovibrio sp.]